MSLAVMSCPPETEHDQPLPLPPLVAHAHSSVPDSQRPPGRHPPALWVLSAAEAGERFGCYLMLALFTLFLNERLELSEAQASDWYGTYLAAVYAAPLFGGWLAGRLGSRLLWIIIGALLLAAGYFVLSLTDIRATLIALGIIVVGSGLFKPNISVLIGELYPRGDSRRDEAFGIFYLAVNAGGMFGPIVGELLRSAFGWSAVFSAAGVALLGATLTLHLGRRLLVNEHSSETEPVEPSKNSRRRVAAVLLLCVVLVPFWMAYQQHGSSLTFWARDNVDRAVRLFGRPHEIPPGWFAGSSALFVLLLTAPMTVLFRRFRLSSASKLAAGVVVGAASFALLYMAALGSGGARVHFGWLIAHYLTMTVAELLLAPIGLSAVSKLSPSRWSGVFFGLWYVSTAAGNWLAGRLGRLWVRWPHDRFFAFVALLLLITAGLLLTQLGWLRRTLPREDA